MKFTCESRSLDDYLEETEVVDYSHFSINRYMQPNYIANRQMKLNLLSPLLNLSVITYLILGISKVHALRVEHLNWVWTLSSL